MPYRRLPTSAPTVQRFLHATRDHWLNTTDPNERAITPEHWLQLDPEDPESLLSRLDKEISEVNIAQAIQGPLTAAAAEKAAELAVLVSHFHQVFDFAVIRKVFAPGDRALYGRDVSATAIPRLVTYDEIVEAAAKIVTGEAARQADANPAESFVPMSLPSAAEVQATLDEFRHLHSESLKAKVRTDQARERLAALLPAAQALAVDICDTVEFFYRKDPSDSSRREKCRRWGVIYVSDPAPEESPTSSTSIPLTGDGPPA